jgi:hypothetical protein
MSPLRVLIAVTLAALLALAAILVLRGGAEGSGGASDGTGSAGGGMAAFAFDPARATEVRVKNLGAGERTERIARLAGASWNVHWDDVDGGEAVWPAAASQVRGALRILSTLEMRAAESGLRVEAPAADVRVVLDDGSERRLLLSGRALAGRVLAEAGSAEATLQAVWIQKDVLEMLVGPPGAAGPRAWRDPSAVPGIGGEVSRAVLQSGSGAASGTLSIGRVQGRWAVREPVSEVAEPEAIARLFSSLSGVRVVDFLDSPTATAQRTGLSAEEQPTAVLALESDLRNADGSSGGVMRLTVAVGQTADLAGQHVFAQVRQELVGRAGIEVMFERVVVVAGEGLASIVMDPAAYVSRRTFATPAADVGAVLLQFGDVERRYERTLDGWRLKAEEGLTPLNRGDEEGITALLNLVMQAPAAHVRLTEVVTAADVSVEITTLGGSPIGAVMLVAREDGGLSVHSRGIERVHVAQEARGVLRWLAAARGG